MGVGTKIREKLKVTSKFYGLFKVYVVFATAFLLSYCISGAISPTSGVSATASPSDCDPTTHATPSGSICNDGNSNLSVSVSNNPLAYYISVSSSHGSSSTPVSLSYSQDGSSGGTLGNVVSSSDNVYLETNSPLNHQLLLSTTSASSTTKANNLIGDNTEESSGSLVTNTYIAPIGNVTTSSLNSAVALSNNTWGFALSSNTSGIETNNFNTTAEYESTDTTTLNSNKYATVPTNNNQVLLLQDTEPTSTTTIYYGVKADRNIPAGSYSNTVLYTALAEQPSEIRVCVTDTSGASPITTCGNGTGTGESVVPTINVASSHQTITIYTSISTASSELGEATVTFIDNSNNVNGKVEDSICTNSTINKDSNNFIYVTCTSPAMPVGTYEVELNLDTFGRVLDQTNAISYTGTPPINNITTMQQMTTDICKTMPIGATKTLQDTRGSYNTTTPANYGIIKAKDNNCWMTDNLNLYNKTVTSADTDISSGNITIPDTSNSTSTSIMFSHRATTSGYTDQVYYNWCSAAAISNCSSVTASQDKSICPKNWTLPTMGGMGKLFSLYNITTGSALVSNSSGLGFRKYYGIWDHGTQKESRQGTYGQFWTILPTADNTLYAWSVTYQSDSIRTGTLDVKSTGLSVRCVAR